MPTRNGPTSSHTLFRVCSKNRPITFGVFDKLEPHSRGKSKGGLSSWNIFKETGIPCFGKSTPQIYGCPIWASKHLLEKSLLMSMKIQNTCHDQETVRKYPIKENMMMHQASGVN